MEVGVTAIDGLETLARYAALTAAEEGTRSIDQKDTLFPSAKWEGRLHSGVWRIAADGEVTAALRADDGCKEENRVLALPTFVLIYSLFASATLVLETAFIPLSFTSRDYEVHFYADYEGFRKAQRVLTDRRGVSGVTSIEPHTSLRITIA